MASSALREGDSCTYIRLFSTQGSVSLAASHTYVYNGTAKTYIFLFIFYHGWIDDLRCGQCNFTLRELKWVSRIEKRQILRRYFSIGFISTTGKRAIKRFFRDDVMVLNLYGLVFKQTRGSWWLYLLSTRDLWYAVAEPADAFNDVTAGSYAVHRLERQLAHIVDQNENR